MRHAGFIFHSREWRPVMRAALVKLGGPIMMNITRKHYVEAIPREGENPISILRVTMRALNSREAVSIRPRGPGLVQVRLTKRGEALAEFFRDQLTAAQTHERPTLTVHDGGLSV